MHSLVIAFIVHIQEKRVSQNVAENSVSINSLNESCESLITIDAANHVKLDLYFVWIRSFRCLETKAIWY